MNIFNPERSKNKALFLSMNNETEYVPLLCLVSRFMIYAPSFILGKLSLEKNAINLSFVVEILSTLDIF